MVDQISRMEEVIQASVYNQQFMGSVLIAKNKHILLNKGYGCANLEWQIPNSPTTKFRLGSLTKQFTAAAIFLLEEKGKLKITDMVNQYLSDSSSTWDNITIFSLLTHTSGIPNYTKFPEFKSITTLPKTPLEQIELFCNKPLEFEPGTQYAYCNSGYVLLGYLIEKISGESYANFVVNHILKPLGMNDSGYDSHSMIIPHRASGYVMTPEGIKNAEYLDMSIPYAAGSLYSTTQDLHRWVEELFGGKILSEASLTKMITPFKNNYACGVVIQTIDDKKIIYHGGGINGFDTTLLYFPDEGLIVVTLANMNAIGYVSQDIAIKMVKLIHGNKVILPSERKEIKISPEILIKCANTYQLQPSNISYNTKIIPLTITVENGYLFAQSENLPKTKLYPESDNVFFAKKPDLQIKFILDEKNEVSNITLHQDGEDSQELPV